MQYSATELIDRIQHIYKSCDQTEQEVLMQILKELADTGTSPTYEQVWLADYKEIPVDIDTFLNSDTYLGKTNRQGQAVYPFWRRALHDIFDAGNKYWEIIFSGATRIGKTSTAISGSSYMLYRLMCLRDPQKFFGTKEISKFSIMFFNITKGLAKGVAFREFNDTLKASPWFCQHGTFSNSELDFYYIPEGNKIIIDYGSDAAHGLGIQAFCLVGDTKILTDTGTQTISELADQYVNVQQLCDGELIYVPAFVVKTKEATETIRVTLEDGTVIEGTPDHRVMLADGTYKCLCDLTEGDDLYTVGGFYE